MLTDMLHAPEVLTPREREVYRATLAGYRNKEIARQLGISEKTVSIFRKNMMEKLGFRNRHELFSFAYRPALEALDAARFEGLA